MPTEPAKSVGIDLGTTFSAIAYVDGVGTPRAIPTSDGAYVTPSAVYIKPDRSIVVGEAALEALRERPDRVAVNFKRDMGEKFYSEPVGGREFSPEALSALVLKKLAQDAVEALGDIGGAVITVPAYFGDARRKATQDAGRIAGLNVIDIINEPTAAALANAFHTFLAQGGEQSDLSIARIAARAPSTTLVYDLGGGTFDVTVIRIDHNDFEVIATGGEVRLGGIDFDKRVVDYFCDEFRRRFGIDPRDTPESMERIRNTCELAKISLSENPQTVLICEHLGRKMQVPITRGRFEQLTADLIARTQISTEMLLEDAMLTWDRIDNILLVGGSSRMPRVARMLAEISGKEPEMAIAPDQIVAHGAALHAAICDFDRTETPQATGKEKRLDFDSAATDAEADKEQQKMQAIMAPTKATAAHAIKLSDVNSHGLGVIVRSAIDRKTVNSVIIPKNTPLPTSRVKLFGTEAKNQRQVRLRITEGDTRDPRGCTQIGECMIRHLPKGLPKGAPVEVSFRYDSSGRIHVKAVELTSRISADVQIERESGFKKIDLDRMTDAVSELDVK
ncbi:MAG: Hsp70 family protein [Planctomycetes bacterium]|nr:Hsp70 family protein [Planctomycetota bacterium]